MSSYSNWKLIWQVQLIIWCRWQIENGLSSSSKWVNGYCSNSIHTNNRLLSEEYTRNFLTVILGPTKLWHILDSGRTNCNYSMGLAFIQSSTYSYLNHITKTKNTVIVPTAEFPPFTNEGEVILEPQKILNTRWVKQGAKLLEEKMVQWMYIPVKEASWEPITKLQDMFPTLSFEDKIPLEEGW